MRAKRTAALLVGAIFAASLVAGCSDPNSGTETNMANLPPPKGVPDKPQVKPFKSRAKVSSPPIDQQPK